GASAALLFATKETAMISAGVLIIALALTFLYMLFDRKVMRQSGAWRSRESDGFSGFIEELGGTTNVIFQLSLALIVFLALYLLFYSSFFTHSKGIWDSMQTFAIWKKTGSQAHVHSALMYF